MAAKRALVVDDSKSARSFLSGILERYELHVDAVESAEDAIEYLTRHRPDVIFMDHLMPGMDGFQAVQAIKNNERTATIPIMMYTSQEGELYLGQARALGAVGVLPKQIKPADVSKVLYQLHLVEDRRRSGQETFTPMTPPPAARPVAMADGEVDAAADAPTMLAPALQQPLVNEALVRDQIAELRRFVVSNLEQQSERIVEDVRRLLAQMPPPLAAPVTEFAPEPPPARADRRAWALAAVAALAAIALAGLWRREVLDREALQGELQRQALAAAAAPPPAESLAEPAVDAVDGVDAAAAPSEPIVAQVPYGEPPFAGERVERVRTVLTDLNRQQFRGIVSVASYHGRFCLKGSGAVGYELAPPETPFERCDLVSPAGEGGGPPGESLPFANMVAEMRKASAGALDIRVSEASGDNPAAAYPTVTQSLTAGQWNAAAAANNRVEIRVIPRS